MDNIKYNIEYSEHLAKLITDSMVIFFSRIFIVDIIYYSTNVKAITIQWSKLSNNVIIYIIIDLDLALYIIKLI